MLARRFRAVALMNLVVSPFLMAFLVIYFFMRNAEKFYHHPRSSISIPTPSLRALPPSSPPSPVFPSSRLSSSPACSSVGARSWSPYAKWRMREFNEMEHFLTHRLAASREGANEYISQFPTPVVRQVCCSPCDAVTGKLPTLSSRWDRPCNQSTSGSRLRGSLRL